MIYSFCLIIRCWLFVFHEPGIINSKTTGHMPYAYLQFTLPSDFNESPFLVNVSIYPELDRLLHALLTVTSGHQFADCAGHSTETALLKVTSDVVTFMCDQLTTVRVSGHFSRHSTSSITAYFLITFLKISASVVSLSTSCSLVFLIRSRMSP